jgi:hypothetical protein
VLALDVRDFLKGLLYTRKNVDDWISGRAFPFGRYDSELGYVHAARRSKDGIDDTISTYTYDRETGARHVVNHPDAPFRVNTYGDSFTQCDQVSDGETWQESLAAHIGEPIRNYGVGAHSVYQMYLRMKKQETMFPSKYIIMNIYDDDHYRSMIPLQNMRSEVGPDHFHPPIPYVRANPTKKEFIEFGNPSPKPEDLYDFCDLDWTYERFKDEFSVKIMLAKTNVRTGHPEDSYRDIEELAEEFDSGARITTPRKLLDVANALFTQAATYASMCIVQKTIEFAARQRRKILFVTSYSTNSVSGQLEPGTKMVIPERRKPGFSYNPRFVDYMRKTRMPWVDLMEAHLRDYSSTSLSVADYLKRYYVYPHEFASHYAPLGNKFLAAAVKKDLVEMMNPKPPAYRRAGFRNDRVHALPSN